MPSPSFCNIVATINRTIYGLTQDRNNLFRLRGESDVAVLCIGERAYSVSPTNVHITLHRIHRINRQFHGGSLVSASIILDLLHNK